MTSVMVYHLVDDVDFWLSSTKRSEIFGALGIDFSTYIDPEGSNKVGLMLDVPDMDALVSFLQSDEALESMKHDGVQPETVQMLVAG